MAQVVAHSPEFKPQNKNLSKTKKKFGSLLLTAGFGVICSFFQTSVADVLSPAIGLCMCPL
jgi:hypothetical protein